MTLSFLADYCINIENFEGILTQMFLMHQAMVCSQIAIQFLLYVFGEERTQVTVSSFHTWRFVRHKAKFSVFGRTDFVVPF
jgi:hypothetical protein